MPWFQFSFSVGRPVYYDPLFSYYAVVNVRQNPQWIVQVREAYVLRRDNVALRPPGTYAEQVRVMRNVSITRDITVVDHRNMAMPLRQLAADRIAGRNLRLEHVAEAERRQIQRQATELHQMREQRAQLERQVARSGPASRPRTANLPHSPVASHPAARPAGHPGGHPAAHPGAEGARAAVAHREAAAGGHEAARGVERAGAGRGASGHAGRAGRGCGGRPASRGGRGGGTTRGSPSRPGREPPRADASDPPRRGSDVLIEGGFARPFFFRSQGRPATPFRPVFAMRICPIPTGPGRHHAGSAPFPFSG